jgi:hypothetical protein
VEHLKRGQNFINQHIATLLNHMTAFFQKIGAACLIQAIFKRGENNDPRNYRIIIISPIVDKLIQGMMERKISKWAQETKKRAEGQVELQPKKDILDHHFFFRGEEIEITSSYT